MAPAKSPTKLQQLGDVGNRLSQPPQTKDAILKNLKQAVSLLSEMGQASAASAKLKPLARILVQSTLLRHKDKEVRLLATDCIMEILRIVAPEAPFKKDEMKDFFESVVAHLRGLDELAGPAFSRRMAILENLAKFKIFLVMLDMDCEELVLEMFQTFFNVASKKHPPSLIVGMQTIMATILQESEVIFEPLIDVVLHYLVKNLKANSSVAHKLAADVVQQCADKLQPYVQRLLTSAMLEGEDPENDSQEEDYHDVIYEVYQCAPQMLIAVIPHLTEELVTGQLDTRLKAVQLLGRLFALPSRHVAKEYHQLFTDFIKRFTDKAVEIRLAMIECAKECIKANPSGEEAREILEGLNDRVLDNEDKVRLQAVTSICELARLNLKCIPMHILKNVAERLRDKKAFVRKEALQRLVEVYKSYCLKCHNGDVMDGDLEWLPGKIIRCCYDKEVKEFRPASLEIIFTEELFPAQLPVEERANHWIAFYSSFDENDKKALYRVLLQKKRLQEEVQEYLSLRKEAKKDDANGTESNIQQKFKSMSLLFMDENKAEDCFQKLHQMKDNKIFRALSQLMDSDLTYARCIAALEDLLKRASANNLQRGFMEQLALRCSYKFFGKEHFKSVAARVAAARNVGDQTLVDAGLALLTEFTGVFPCLAEAIKDDLVGFLMEDDGSLKERIVEVLAKAGSFIRGQIENNSSSVELTLQNLCLEGTRREAKHAVAALAGIKNDSGFKSLSVLYGRLVKALDENNPYLPTVLLSLSCIAKHSMAVFETQEDFIIRFVVRKLLRRSSGTGLEGHAGVEDDWNNQSIVCQLKVFGLETLVKSFLPLKGHPRKPLTGLTGILTALLAKGEVSEDVKSSNVDKAHLRLSAAIGVLRLARRLDVYIPVQLFEACVLIGQDPWEEVRHRFLIKVFKYLKDRSLSHKYASVFPLFALESSKELLISARQYCNEFIEIAHREAKSKQTSAAFTNSSSPLTFHPEYVLTYLVHVLAHHPLFPISNTEVLANAYEPFHRMLHFYIRSLIRHESEGSLRKDDAENIPAILAIFRAIKKARDAILDSQTLCLQITCDLGIVITKELGRHRLYSETYPGPVPLPSSLYKLSEEIKSEVDGSSLPLCLSKSNALAQFSARGSRFGQGSVLKTDKGKGSNGELVGSMIKFWCSFEKRFSRGLVKSFDPKKRKHEVLDQDGSTKHLQLEDEQWETIGGFSGAENIPLDSSLVALPSFEKRSSKRRKSQGTVIRSKDSHAADSEGEDTCVDSLDDDDEEFSLNNNECAEATISDNLRSLRHLSANRRTKKSEEHQIIHEPVDDDTGKRRSLRHRMMRNEERATTSVSAHGKSIIKDQIGEGNRRDRSEERAVVQEPANDMGILKTVDKGSRIILRNRVSRNDESGPTSESAHVDIGSGRIQRHSVARNEERAATSGSVHASPRTDRNEDRGGIHELVDDMSIGKTVDRGSGRISRLAAARNKEIAAISESVPGGQRILRHRVARSEERAAPPGPVHAASPRTDRNEEREGIHELVDDMSIGKIVDRGSGRISRHRAARNEEIAPIFESVPVDIGGGRILRHRVARNEEGAAPPGPVHAASPRTDRNEDRAGIHELVDDTGIGKSVDRGSGRISRRRAARNEEIAAIFESVPVDIGGGRIPKHRVARNEKGTASPGPVHAASPRADQNEDRAGIHELVDDMGIGKSVDRGSGRISRHRAARNEDIAAIFESVPVDIEGGRILRHRVAKNEERAAPPRPVHAASSRTDQKEDRAGMHEHVDDMGIVKTVDRGNRRISRHRAVRNEETAAISESVPVDIGRRRILRYRVARNGEMIATPGSVHGANSGTDQNEDRARTHQLVDDTDIEKTVDAGSRIILRHGEARNEETAAISGPVHDTGIKKTVDASRRILRHRMARNEDMAEVSGPVQDTGIKKTVDASGRILRHRMGRNEDMAEVSGPVQDTGIKKTVDASGRILRHRMARNEDMAEVSGPVQDMGIKKTVDAASGRILRHRMARNEEMAEISGPVHGSGRILRHRVTRDEEMSEISAPVQDTGIGNLVNGGSRKSPRKKAAINEVKLVTSVSIHAASPIANQNEDSTAIHEPVHGSGRTLKQRLARNEEKPATSGSVDANVEEFIKSRAERGIGKMVDTRSGRIRRHGVVINEEEAATPRSVHDTGMGKTADMGSKRILRDSVLRNEERAVTSGSDHGHSISEPDIGNLKIPRRGTRHKRNQTQESAGTFEQAHASNGIAEVHVISLRSRRHETEGTQAIHTEDNPVIDHSNSETVVGNRRNGVVSTRTRQREERTAIETFDGKDKPGKRLRSSMPKDVIMNAEIEKDNSHGTNSDFYNNESMSTFRHRRRRGNG